MWQTFPSILIVLLILVHSTDAALGNIRLHRKRSHSVSQVHPAEPSGKADHALVEGENRDSNSSETAQQLHETAGRSWDELPRLAWVVSQSPERLGNWSVALSALNCYCALHGIPLYYETKTVLKDDRSCTG
ncbi:hypothetical protein WJX75_006220 [Coccomyxa subellipsoidea]|uniref:Uncharacterized protein n=1 Tax=Coccomyxa subellipsoidea TaxID=248742 RepID=A0ABR2YVW2_9CHLO